MTRPTPRLEGPARRVGRGELIGLPCRIVASTDPGLQGRQGTIVDETLRTLRLRLADGRTILTPKAACTFAVESPAGPVELPGRAILFRPTERIKKVR